MTFRSIAPSLLFVALVACTKPAEPVANDTNGAGNLTETAAVTTDTTATATATHPASPGGTALVPSATGGTTVVVVIEDGSVAVQSQNIPAGPAVFTITNASATNTHNLFVEGPGLSRAAGDTIPEKTSRSVDMTLQHGTYTLYCPVLDHRTRGEQATMTVE